MHPNTSSHTNKEITKYSTPAGEATKELSIWGRAAATACTTDEQVWWSVPVQRTQRGDTCVYWERGRMTLRHFRLYWWRQGLCRASWSPCSFSASLHYQIERKLFSQFRRKWPPRAPCRMCRFKTNNYRFTYSVGLFFLSTESILACREILNCRIKSGETAE